MFFLPIFGGPLVVDVHEFPLGVVFISVCAVGVIRDKCVTSGVCRVIEITVDEDVISEACVENDDVTLKVFAVVVGTTGEVVTFEVCVAEEVTVDDDVTFEPIEVLEVRKCGAVIRADRVGAFVVVTRGTNIYDGNSKLI